MMVREEMYFLLPSFNKHGAPCLDNFRHARERGYTLAHFPVDEYVNRLSRGTASRHGYNLGLRGKINHLLNKFGL